jgi:hypothetical protein
MTTTGHWVGYVSFSIRKADRAQVGQTVGSSCGRTAITC